MVRIQQPSEHDVLDGLVRRQCERAALRLEVEGWTRKTYSIYTSGRLEQPVLVARVETFATTNGEIRVYDDRGMPFAEALAKELEQAFPIQEAVILREEPKG